MAYSGSTQRSAGNSRYAVRECGELSRARHNATSQKIILAMLCTSRKNLRKGPNQNRPRLHIGLITKQISPFLMTGPFRQTFHLSQSKPALLRSATGGRKIQDWLSANNFPAGSDLRALANSILSAVTGEQTLGGSDLLLKILSQRLGNCGMPPACGVPDHSLPGLAFGSGTPGFSVTRAMF